MKRPPDMIEGEEAFQRFDAAIQNLLSVPRAEMLRREAEYQKQAVQNPKRRGPKPKTRPSVSSD